MQSNVAEVRISTEIRYEETETTTNFLLYIYIYILRSIYILKSSRGLYNIPPEYSYVYIYYYQKLFLYSNYGTTRSNPASTVQ